MRSLLLLFTIIIIMPSALMMPHLGILIWTWLSIMNPHRLSYGLTVDIPFVMIIASITIAGWLFSREPKRPPARFMVWAAVAFGLHTTLTSSMALYPDLSWPLWDRTIKTLVLFLFAAMLIQGRVRIQALLWILAISLGFFATTGIIDTLASGGKNILAGPRNTMLADNNHLALSLVMVLPILNYLRQTTANRFVRLALVAVIIFTVVAVITSYSRGGLIALSVGSFAFLRSAKGRVAIIALLFGVGMLVFSVMPDKWHARISTIESIEEDQSFSGRQEAWFVSWNLALDRPLVGGGFSSTEKLGTFLRYLPDATRGRAAHSIYFQVLGDHGFVGLSLYLLMLASALFYLRRTRKRVRLAPELLWADQLAKMLQISLLSFLVGGAALSVAYHDLILMILVITMSLDLTTARILNAAPKTEPAVAEPPPDEPRSPDHAIIRPIR